MTKKMPKDMAEDEFHRFTEAMDLEFDVEEMDDKDREAFENHKKVMIKALRDGSLVINENGEPTYTLKKSKTPTTLTFREPRGSSFIAMDGKKMGDVGKMYACMADMTGVHQSTFSNAHYRDLKVMQTITTLFLA